MSFWEIAAYLIALLLLLVILRIFKGPFKTILWLSLNSFFGWVGLTIFNSALAFSGFSVGVNIVTAAVCGLLGIPGLVLIVILKFIFFKGM